MNHSRRTAASLALALFAASSAPVTAFDMWSGWGWGNWTLVGAQFTPTTNVSSVGVAGWGNLTSRNALAQRVTVGFSGYVDHVDLLISTLGNHISSAGDLELVISNPRLGSTGHYSGSMPWWTIGRKIYAEYVPFYISNRSGGPSRLWVNAGDTLVIELKAGQPRYIADYAWHGRSGDPYSGGSGEWWIQTDSFAGYYWRMDYDFAFRVHLR